MAFTVPEFKLDLSEADAIGGSPFDRLRQQMDAKPSFEVQFTPLPSFASKPKPVPRAKLPGAGPSSALPLSLAEPPAPVQVPKGVVNTSSWTGHGTHVTDGLDLNHGQKTAVDIMAKPGTAVAAPASGVVVRHGSAQGGDSMYFRDDSGKTWWLGHIDGRYSLPPGTRVKAGQTLSRISADHAAPHLHLDREL